MRASSAMKLLSTCCGGFLITLPGLSAQDITTLKAIKDDRVEGDPYCGESSCLSLS